MGWMRRQLKKKQYLLLLQLMNRQSHGYDQVDKSEAKRLVKLSRKFSASDINIGAQPWTTFHNLLRLTNENDSFAKTVRHLPALSVDFISQLQTDKSWRSDRLNCVDILDYVVLHQLAIGGRRSVGYDTKVQQVWHFLQDGSYIQENLKRRGIDTTIPRFRTMKSVQLWHDAVAKQLDELEHPLITFTQSPYSDIEGVTYLRNSHELQAEGRAMHHCVGSYSRYCAKDEARIYHVLHAGEEATLELTNGKDRWYSEEGTPEKWAVAQIRGKCNGAVSQNLKQFVAAWFTECQIANQDYLRQDIRDYVTGKVVREYEVVCSDTCDTV